MEPIKFEKFTLDNGLDVILHRDASLPLVAVNVWYHVGSKDEERGKTGFAHLFEHLMFEGSKHHNREFFEPLQQAGANLNCSTTTDRTNYLETLPSNYLELALWLESDRMGFLLDTVDQKRLDIQRDVVKNERRQSYENRPYGMAGLELQGAVYPWPHPYHWPTIGSHEDLEAATLDDVHAFFRRFYRPSNASLAIAGDIVPSEVKELVNHYFSDLPSGPPPASSYPIDSPLADYVSLVLEDKVLLPQLNLIWPSTPRFHPDEAPLSILAAILSDGRSSRLQRSLVYEQRVAQGIGAYHDAQEIAGDFSISVTAAAGKSAQEIEEATRIELERIQLTPPTEQELTRAKNQIEFRRVRQMASIGGFGGKANQLNAFNVLAGDPSFLNGDLDRFIQVQAEDVSRVARDYLGQRQVRLVVLPESSRGSSVSMIDRTVQPLPTEPKSFAPPKFDRSVLPNGLNIVVAEKHELPIVACGVVIKTGAVVDPLSLPGLAAFTSVMLQEGTENRTSREISDEFDSLGSQLAITTGRERTLLLTETLTRHWPDALNLISDLIQSPSFPDEELDRVRQQRVTGLERLRDDPTALADRIAPMLLFGTDTPYGHPLQGTVGSLQRFTKNDLAKHFQKYFNPKDSTLVVVGDVTMDEVATRAADCLGSWAIPSDETSSDVARPSEGGSGSTRMFLLDKVGASQSVIRAGLVGVSRTDPDYYPLLVLNHLFGGQFTARLNMNLRQDKGFSYGYRSSIEWHRDTSLIVAGGSVQTSVTQAAIEETLMEFRAIASDRPVERTEFDSAKSSLLRQFPSSFETHQQILGSLAQLISFALPDDYYQEHMSRIEEVTLEQVQQAASQHLTTSRLAILVVGDREMIESGVKEIGIPVTFLDFEGHLINEN